jgi:hypothetical protein
MAVLERRSPGALSRGLGRRVGLPGLGIVLAGMVAAGALLPVAQSSDATATGYQIRLLEAQQADLTARLQIAQAEVAALAATDRIEREAGARLGMAPAERRLFVPAKEAAPPHVLPARLRPAVPPAAPVTPEPWWMAVLERLPRP